MKANDSACPPPPEGVLAYACQPTNSEAQTILGPLSDRLKEFWKRQFVAMRNHCECLAAGWKARKVCQAGRSGQIDPEHDVGPQTGCSGQN